MSSMTPAPPHPQPCKTKSLIVRYGFTKKQNEHGNGRAKIHFLDENKNAKCNLRLKIAKGFTYEHEIGYLMWGKIFPCDVCLTCLRKRISEGASP